MKLKQLMAEIALYESIYLIPSIRNQVNFQTNFFEGKYGDYVCETKDEEELFNKICAQMPLLELYYDEHMSDPNFDWTSMTHSEQRALLYFTENAYLYLRKKVTEEQMFPFEEKFVDLFELEPSPELARALGLESDYFNPEQMQKFIAMLYQDETCPLSYEEKTQEFARKMFIFKQKDKPFFEIYETLTRLAVKDYLKYKEKILLNFIIESERKFKDMQLLKKAA